MTEESGLSRQMTPIGAWALALGCIVGWGAFIMPGTSFLPQAGPLGSAIALAVAAAVMCVIALNFHFMMNRFPVAGGAFVYAQETFGRAHGFACAWFLALAYLVPIPLNATALALISRNLLDGVFEFGLSYNIAGYDVYIGEILIIASVITLFAIVILRNSRGLNILVTALTLCLVAGVAIIGASALTSPVASFDNMQPLFSPTDAPAVGVLAIVATSPWAFVGFDAISQLAEEANFSLRKAAPIMMIAIAMGAIIYITLNTVAASVVPAGYEGWSDYVSALPNLSGLASMPLFYAVEAIMGPTGLIVLDIATLAAILTGIVGFFIANSRIFYAMAQHDVLPEWFGQVDSKYHSPVNAVLIILFVAFTASLFGRTILGWVIDMLSVATAIGFFYTSASVWKTAREEGRSGWKACGIVGAVFSVAFLLLLMVPNPLLGTALQQESYIFLLAWAVLGINFYTPQHKETATKLPGEYDIES